MENLVNLLMFFTFQRSHGNMRYKQISQFEFKMLEFSMVIFNLNIPYTQKMQIQFHIL